MDLTNLNKDRKARRKTESLELGTMMYGKVPPQARDLEAAILGAIMIEKGAFEIVADILTPDTFYVEANGRIFSAIMKMSQSSMPIDILTVVAELKKREELDLIGGAHYVTKLTDRVVSSANIEAHARIVLQEFIKRKVIEVGSKMIGDAYEESTDVFDLLDSIETNVSDLTLNYIKKDYSTIDKGLVKVIERIEHLRKMDESITGIPSGYMQLDTITHGWQPTDLIILAARPSVGKTSFALNLARKASMHHSKPTPIGFFSLEMSEGQLITRILSSQTEIWLTRLSTGRLDDEQMQTLYRKGVQPLSQAPICIDDTAGLNIFELRSKARRMKNKHGVGLIIIDYLQLMSADKDKRGTREQEISSISRDLKQLAKELELPIIALSQLSREVEKRASGKKEPKLIDLRESGAIEQDGDLVIFLYRPSDEEIKEDPQLKKTMGHLKIAKHRNGTLGEIVFKVSDNIQVWEEHATIVTSGSNYIPIAKANAQQEELFKQNGKKDNDDPDEEMPF